MLCRELIWTTAGPKFGSEEGSTMVVKMDIYGLKYSGASFRAKLSSLLHNTAPASITYLSVVSRYSVLISLTITALNGMAILSSLHNSEVQGAHMDHGRTQIRFVGG